MSEYVFPLMLNFPFKHRIPSPLHEKNASGKIHILEYFKPSFFENEAVEFTQLNQIFI